MPSVADLRRWIKARETPLARMLYRLGMGTRTFSVPVIRPIHKPLYLMHNGVRTMIGTALQKFWYTPLFQTRLEKPAKRLDLWGGMPVVLGPLKITMGDNCCIAGVSTITGRSASSETPELIFGDNVGLGWQTMISVGRKVVIGNNCRISGKSFLAGYPGHPIDAKARAEHLPDTEDQVGDIILEDDVWLGTGVTVSTGVTIGRGTIVAAGSCVTRSLPPFVLAAGVPATVKRSLLPMQTGLDPDDAAWKAITADAAMAEAIADESGRPPRGKAA